MNIRPPLMARTSLERWHLRSFRRDCWRLYERSERATPKGDVGKLDFDPVCSCQDSSGLKLKDLHITMDGTGKALATTMLFFPEPTTIEVRLSLIWTPQGWRIDDIWTKDVPGLAKVPSKPRGLKQNFCFCFSCLSFRAQRANQIGKDARPDKFIVICKQDELGTAIRYFSGRRLTTVADKSASNSLRSPSTREAFHE